MTIAINSTELGLSPNVRVGEQVRLWLRRRGITQQQLAERLEIKPASLSRKISGTTGWTVNDLVTTAAVLDVELTDLLPTETIDQEKARLNANPPAEAGGENASRLRESNSRPIHYE